MLFLILFYWEAWVFLAILIAKSNLLLNFNLNTPIYKQALISNVPKNRIVTLASSEYIPVKNEKNFIWM